MLSKPNFGWTRIKIGEFDERASYLDDVPINCLNAAIHSAKTGLPFCVDFDAEGYEFTVVSNYDGTSIIIDGENGKELKSVDVKFKEIAKQLINEIKMNLDQWVEWNYYEEEYGVRREELLMKLKELSELVL